MIRFAAALPALAALSACGGETDQIAVDPDSMIECALGDAAEFARECWVDETLQEGTLLLTVRHPDGGFRRFEVLQDGRGLAAADGADMAEVMLADGGIEVTLGPDRYRFPATIKSDAGE